MLPLRLILLNIQPVVVVRGLKRQQAASLTNFVGCLLLALSYFFFLFPLNDLTLSRITYSIPFLKANTELVSKGFSLNLDRFVCLNRHRFLYTPCTLYSHVS